MMKFVTMKNKKETKPKYTCEFCKKSYARERTLVSHLCEYKDRWLSKDTKVNKLGFQVFLHFYQAYATLKKKYSYDDFMRSPYYTAFVKFARYCIDSHVINTTSYVAWLLKNKIKVDSWYKDNNYTLFLYEYVLVEDAMDALRRSVNHTLDLADEMNLQAKDVLRYGNPNRIAYSITSAKISPWLLYHSKSGLEFLDKAEGDILKIIFDYIEPNKWADRFKKYPEDVIAVKKVLDEAGY